METANGPVEKTLSNVPCQMQKRRMDPVVGGAYLTVTMNPHSPHTGPHSTNPIGFYAPATAAQPAMTYGSHSGGFAPAGYRPVPCVLSLTARPPPSASFYSTQHTANHQGSGSAGWYPPHHQGQSQAHGQPPHTKSQRISPEATRGPTLSFCTASICRLFPDTDELCYGCLSSASYRQQHIQYAPITNGLPSPSHAATVTHQATTSPSPVTSSSFAAEALAQIRHSAAAVPSPGLSVGRGHADDSLRRLLSPAASTFSSGSQHLDSSTMRDSLREQPQISSQAPRHAETPHPFVQGEISESPSSSPSIDGPLVTFVQQVEACVFKTEPMSPNDCSPSQQPTESDIPQPCLGIEDAGSAPAPPSMDAPVASPKDAVAPLMVVSSLSPDVGPAPTLTPLLNPVTPLRSPSPPAISLDLAPPSTRPATRIQSPVKLEAAAVADSQSNDDRIDQAEHVVANPEMNDTLKQLHLLHDLKLKSDRLASTAATLSTNHAQLSSIATLLDDVRANHAALLQEKAHLIHRLLMVHEDLGALADVQHALQGERDKVQGELDAVDDEYRPLLGTSNFLSELLGCP
ncbi:hypothetical protein BCR44DRAFT_1534097 [Catenaria anguillulae PL171]|uniref:Uncharacterized protein n=1 Tax=Catenaria anguillulae PL171 TaxID=765915 RepID=A0A1Y2HGU8_9FUNG|nr:hypothetical protein BCR44DRAFT_1534097 [Catenaria anguillulae PL171]